MHCCCWRLSTRRISDLEYVYVQLQVWVQVWVKEHEQLTNAGEGHDHHEGEWQHLRLERHLPVVHALQQQQQQYTQPAQQGT